LKIALEAILFINMVVKLLVEDKINKIYPKIVFLKHFKDLCVKKGTFGSGTDSRIGSGSIKLIYKSKYGSISVYKSRFSAR